MLFPKDYDLVGSFIPFINGARGFFVISLASNCPLMDRLPDPLLMNLRAGGEIVVDLTVRNLAMSTAMALHHQRNRDSEKQAGSERVIARCQELLRLLEPNQVKTRLERLLEATHGKGEDLAFLDHWGYDYEQKLAIASSIHKIANS